MSLVPADATVYERMRIALSEIGNTTSSKEEPFMHTPEVERLRYGVQASHQRFKLPRLAPEFGGTTEAFENPPSSQLTGSATTTNELYLQTALRLQRWRDLAAHLTAYVVMNVVFIIAWATNGGGYFWPAWTLLGWGLGLSFQHFHVVIRGFIPDAEVRRAMQPAAGPTGPKS